VKDGHYHDYLRYYSHDFLPDIMWWKYWVRIRKSFELKDVPFLIAIENIAIFRYKEIYVVLFDQYITHREKREKIHVGTNKFFISFYDNIPKLRSEEFLALPDLKSHGRHKHPLLAASDKFIELVDQKEKKKAEHEINVVISG